MKSISIILVGNTYDLTSDALLRIFPKPATPKRDDSLRLYTRKKWPKPAKTSVKMHFCDQNSSFN